MNISTGTFPLQYSKPLLLTEVKIDSDVTLTFYNDVEAGEKRVTLISAMKFNKIL